MFEHIKTNDFVRKISAKYTEHTPNLHPHKESIFGSKKKFLSMMKLNSIFVNFLSISRNLPNTKGIINYNFKLISSGLLSF